ncbi:hypothetical protein SAMN05444416_11275 [Thermoactinomyces sp. DSM 45892]|nr:hypothetical protein SAMN05444416_11275 [Thermoactinomyces sp. DSM 45892]
MFPPEDHLERLAKYKRMRKLFEGKHWEVLDRASSIYQNHLKKQQLNTLYMACNMLGILTSKPSDLMFGNPPIYEVSKDSNSNEQGILNSIVERNRLNLLGREITAGSGYRGDSFIKAYFDYRDDVSELPYVPSSIKMEPIISAQDPSTVFPELARGSRKRFKAVNIAYIEWISKGKTEIPILNVERHIPGFIEYSRFRLSSNGPEGYSTQYGIGITTYTIEEEIPTGREEDLVETGIPHILIYHVPHQTTDENWEGRGTVEMIEDLVAGVNDRLVQIDYILYKHSDPNMYGPDLADSKEMSSGGIYIPVRKDEIPPAYMVWNSQLEGAFRELELLLSMIYQVAETPQWLFGQTVSHTGGTGTSHTDQSSIKARFMPILSKVQRIRDHVDYAFRSALRDALQLANRGNAEIDGFQSTEVVLPKIRWNDGLPKDEKEMAEVMQIRTGAKATIDVLSAIKQLDNVDDSTAEEIVSRIKDEEEEALTVQSSIFNQETSHVTDSKESEVND